MKFNHIGIIGKQDRPAIQETVKKLIGFLNNTNKTFILSNETLPNATYEHLPQDKLAKTTDLLIVVGGDGSLLSAARDAVLHDTPIVGINLGCLGFLSDICPTTLEKQLEQIFDDQYQLEQRFLLDTFINNETKSVGLALNEIVLSPGKAPHMIEFETYIDHEFMYSQRSDGMIIATPTGSTAYALSAGGPIVHPTLNAITLIPMFPHALTNRPIVIDGDSQIEIHLSAETTRQPQLICDSQTIIQLNTNDKILIKKCKKSLQLIHPMNYNYFDALHSKLHWERELPCDK